MSTASRAVWRVRRVLGKVKRRVQRWGRRVVPARPVDVPSATPSVVDPAAEIRLLIGPSNMAGQGWQWARAAERFLPGVSAESLTAARSRPGFDFRTDTTLSGPQQRTDLVWHRDRVLAQFTHVLFEAGRPVLRDFHAGSMLEDVDALRAAGIAIGAVFHGSEVRDPRRHAALYPHTAFADPAEDLTGRLQVVVGEIHRSIERFDGPTFVSTPDLLDFVPGATWLPVVVGVDEFASDAPVLERDRPVVLHAPSNSALKGSVFIDPVLQELDERGLIEYRRVSGLPHAELVDLVRSADIVVDQCVLGLYGVFAAESMAAGRVTLAHVAPHVRARVPFELPIVEITPATVREVVERIVEQRDEAVKTAQAGVEYTRRFHDGRAAAAALEPFLTGKAVA